MKNLIKKWLGLTDSVKIGIKLTDAKIPTYTRDGDACVDLRATHDITIKPKETALVKTGIKIQFIPKGWMLRVTNRSGMALKNRILVGNSDGVIDEVPSRYTYPPSEQSLNGSNREAAVAVQGADLLTTKVWWDVN